MAGDNGGQAEGEICIGAGIFRISAFALSMVREVCVTAHRGQDCDVPLILTETTLAERQFLKYTRGPFILCPRLRAEFLNSNSAFGHASPIIAFPILATLLAFGTEIALIA
jgi:hypothetical protein